MKYTITKSGNYGIITPIPTGILDATLDKYLQYERQGKEHMPNPEWAIVHFWKPRTGKFPWGLLYMVRAIMNKYCTAKNEEYIILAPAYPLPKENTVSSDLRPYQIDAIDKLIENGGGILSIATGGGKTKTIIEYLKKMHLDTTVLVTTLDIKSQWEKEVKDLPFIKIYNWQNTKFPKKLKRGKKYTKEQKLNNRMKELSNPIKQSRIVVFDECHHVSANSIYMLAMLINTDTIIIGCSGTTKRDDGEDMKIKAALGRIVYHISRKTLIDQGYLANATAVYLKPKFQTKGKYMDYQKVYNLEIVNNADRNKLIVETAIHATQKHRKVLILVSQIDHGEKLLELLTPNSVEFKIIFMNGLSKDRDRDMSVYDIIIATSIYDEGYNLPSLDTLILAAGGKSSIKLTQRIGRVLRLKKDGRLAIVYDFIDLPKYLKEQYEARRKILEEEFEVIEQNAQQKLGGI